MCSKDILTFEVFKTSKVSTIKILMWKMRKIIEVKSLPGKKIFVKYSNGMEGIISLERLAKRELFAGLRDVDIIEDIHVDSKSGDIIVNGNIELCKTALYGIFDLKKQMLALGLPMGD